ncbi:hypothetical protein AVEN_233349-1, partial [Araneus ventricosus]
GTLEDRPPHDNSTDAVIRAKWPPLRANYALHKSLSKEEGLSSAVDPGNASIFVPLQREEEPAY